jgi:dipeptidyl aminopeptidase/acylaminoacyl peptidase
VVYYDYADHNYYSYNTLTGEAKNITQNAAVSWVDEEPEWPAHEPTLYFIAGWHKADKGVYIYDRYDIWRADLTGGKKPVNVTRGYGRRNKTVLRFSDHNHVFNDNEKVMVRGFNEDSKDQGFYELQPGIVQNPVKLSTGAYLLNTQRAFHAKNGKGHIYIQETATSAPNYFYTSDHRRFKQLTDIQPQKGYNWMAAKLINWTMLDGNPSQGILYMPENFDSTKKYPVIFYYYMGGMSNKLHEFVRPAPTVTLDYAYYASNGYLVCVPDIHFKTGAPGHSAYNAVVSAASYLSQFSWIDSTRMGLAGHSFGAYETNYLVAHSNKFRAAYAGCGYGNLVRLYGQSSVGLYWCEIGQTGIGNSLTDSPELYISNSPVFNTANIKTPLLLLSNKKDITNYEHGLELFIALRRQRKPAWMLQYDNGGHGLDGNDVNDFALRQSQFFDHYLKGASPPVWMTKGISPLDKRIKDGFEPDLSHSCSDTCSICNHLTNK